ncbi:MAG: hypothetical protein MJE68_31845 [Proteobacteria bacterium]|nr:hypothetical protein [Pseudomonadota bacterium]
MFLKNRITYLSNLRISVLVFRSMFLKNRITYLSNLRIFLWPLYSHMLRIFLWPLYSHRKHAIRPYHPVKFKQRIPWMF